jgi:hypothetical protein
MSNDKIIKEWCPKLQLCYESACREKNITLIKDYTDYAIYPQLIYKNVNMMNKEKDIDFCFLGAFAFRRGQDIGINNRKWILDFAKDNFTSNSFFVNTTKNLNLYKTWEPLGIYDYTFDEKYDFKAPKYMDNKNHYDEEYYKIMCRSKFALCPAGDLMWSMRFYEALLTHTIPIINTEEEYYRNDLEKKIDYKFYYTGDTFIYREDWVKHNYDLFIKYHTFQ